jgi:uncharacterized repeat protein (TIGR03803 family)
VAKHLGAGLIADSAGNLYGTTQIGGASGNGVVFKLSPSGTETVLHAFTGGSDGGAPICDLVADSAGNLYGTTAQGGGASGSGVVFKLAGTGFVTVPFNAFSGKLESGTPLILTPASPWGAPATGSIPPPNR